MRALRIVAVVAAVVLVAGVSARADWDRNEPFKYLQPPDLSSMGMDVNATYNKVLADDFPCFQTGLITDIHIWGSWRDDVLPAVPPTFRLSIHADVPAGPGGPNFSMPGKELWARVFKPSEYAARIWEEVPEGWYDPNTGDARRDDHQLAWQYNFLINPDEAFKQEGTSARPMIYWLDVTCMLGPDTNAMFGWKTSVTHWMDNAVVGHADAAGGPITDWRPLYDPFSPIPEQPLDMAFVITPEPATMALLGLGLVGILARRRRR